MGKLSQTKISVLDEFEKKSDEWNFGNFEQALSKAMGNSYGNYQTAKMTILDAHKDGRWPNVVKRYILTNLESFGNSPAELVGTANSILSSMTDSERENWGVSKDQLTKKR